MLIRGNNRSGRNRGTSVVPWTPKRLFSAGEQGVWFDASDRATLFQDAAGTTPVTAFEQPVGRWLDKSGRGNHATQATAASRPVYSARYNLLLGTETLATQSVTTVATSHVLRFTGAGTVTLSGTATGTLSAGTHTVTCTAGTLTLTVSGSVTQADLRQSNEGVGLPPYQRVTTATDYDTAGFPAYLRFDGIDDRMLVSGLSFTQSPHLIIAAARCDVASRDIIGTGGTSGGSALLMNFSSRARAHVWRSVLSSVDSTNTLPTPSTAIYGQVVDSTTISARLNGVSNSAALKGTATTPATTLVLGHRHVGVGAEMLNGRLYSAIVRGALSTPAQVAAAENLLRLQSKAY